MMHQDKINAIKKHADRMKFEAAMRGDSQDYVYIELARQRLAIENLADVVEMLVDKI